MKAKRMTLQERFHAWKEKAQSFIKTPEGREWYWYGMCFLGFLGFLVVLAILFDLVIMPRYVGLDKVVRVPNVSGMTQSQAFKALEEKGLQPRVRGQYFNANVPAGYVTAQLPYPDAEVKPDRSIYLDVSRGKQMIEVPNLVGLNLRDAKLALLRTNGLEMNRVAYDYNENLPPDYIYSQSIREKTKVPVGTQIDVKVSLGYKETSVIVPDVEGKSLEEAQIAITAVGLVVGEVSKGERSELNQTLRPGTVIAQVPPKGETVPSGTPINLTVTR